MKVIETKNLTKYYGKSRGILDLNLEVEEGDIFGFIGPNGAGKSTTIRTLLGLISASSGEGTVFGMDIHTETKNILKRVGYMPGEANFYQSLRVRDMIKLSADLRKKDCRKKAASLCERLQLDTNKKIEELSLGNKKKVSIVCALQHEPDLYILDEPTSGLDPLMQQEFFQLLKEENKRGATIFLSSHVLSEIQNYCKHAGIVKDGKLIMVNSVVEMSKSNTKRILIQGIDQLPALEGVVNVEQNKEGFQFLYQGNMPDLIEKLQGLPIQNMNMTDPTLEEIFLHFYQEK
jgi:ABC-2 type transport system ATP-binding protein